MLDAVHIEHFRHQTSPVTLAELNHHVDASRDVSPRCRQWPLNRVLQAQVFHPLQRRPGTVAMHGGHAAVVAGIAGRDKVRRHAVAKLPAYDAKENPPAICNSCLNGPLSSPRPNITPPSAIATTAAHLIHGPCAQHAILAMAVSHGGAAL